MTIPGLKDVYSNHVLQKQTYTAPTSARTLTEAYKQINEKQTAFYSKEYTSENPPEIADAEFLGSVEKEDLAQRATISVKSFTIYELACRWLTEAGWLKSGSESAQSFVNPRALAERLVEYEISAQEIFDIVDKRSKLMSLKESLEKYKEFNLFDALFEGLKDIGIDSSKKQNFYNLFDWLYSQRGEIDSTNVGPSEFLISLLTNSKKPPKGDLQLGPVVVEAKGSTKANSKAALGYAPYAMEYLRSTLTDVKAKLTPEQTKDETDRAILTRFASFMRECESFREYAEELGVDFDPILDLCKSIRSIFGKSDWADQLRSQGLYKKDYGSRGRGDMDAYFFLLQKGFVDDRSEMSASDRASLGRWFLQTIISTINDRVEQSSNLKLKGSSEGDSSLSMTFKNTILSGIEWSKENMVEILMALRPNQTVSSSLKSDIEKMLTPDVLRKLKRGNESVLQALVFAVHLSEYAAKEKFDIMLLSRMSDGKAISIPASKGAAELFDFFQKESENIRFDVVFSDRQGAHIISVK